jgi:hypothetical protein
MSDESDESDETFETPSLKQKLQILSNKAFRPNESYRYRDSYRNSEVDIPKNTSFSEQELIYLHSILVEYIRNNDLDTDDYFIELKTKVSNLHEKSLGDIIPPDSLFPIKDDYKILKEIITQHYQTISDKKIIEVGLKSYNLTYQSLIQKLEILSKHGGYKKRKRRKTRKTRVRRKSKNKARSPFIRF